MHGGEGSETETGRSSWDGTGVVVVPVAHVSGDRAWGGETRRFSFVECLWCEKHGAEEGRSGEAGVDVEYVEPA